MPGAVLGFTLGIVFGMAAALHHGRWPDKLFSAIATTGVSLPHYWCAIVLVLAFAVLNDFLPAQGMGDDSLPLWERLQYLVLPVITLSRPRDPDGRHRGGWFARRCWRYSVKTLLALCPPKGSRGGPLFATFARTRRPRYSR